jgi:hypothetical protein
MKRMTDKRLLISRLKVAYLKKCKHEIIRKNNATVKSETLNQKNSGRYLLREVSILR